MQLEFVKPASVKMLAQSVARRVCIDNSISAGGGSTVLVHLTDTPERSKVKPISRQVIIYPSKKSFKFLPLALKKLIEQSKTPITRIVVLDANRSHFLGVKIEKTFDSCSSFGSVEKMVYIVTAL